MCYQISGGLSIHLAATCVESAALGPSLIALRPVDLSELQGKTSCLEGLGPQVTDTGSPLDQLVFLMRPGPAMPCWKCSSESYCVQFSHATSKSLPSMTLGCCSRPAVQFCLLLYPHFSPTESQVGFYWVVWEASSPGQVGPHFILVSTTNQLCAQSRFPVCRVQAQAQMGEPQT